MNEEQFQRSAYVLGKEHSVDILSSIRPRGWCKASDVAKRLKLHIATASKYLAEMEEIGVLESRIAMGKTRQVIEYRMKDPRLILELDMSEKGLGSIEDSKFYTEIFNAILEGTMRLYGIKPSDMNRYEVNDKNDSKIMKDEIRKLLEYNENKLGVKSTQRLICSTCKPVLKDERWAQRGPGLLNDLPLIYFEKILEEST